MRFRALDSWRGIAAALVMFVHLSANGMFHYFPPVLHGGLSVPFFFVLSGFVITHANREGFATFSAVKVFIVRRFGRIYPLHFVTLMLLVILEFMKRGLLNLGFSSGQAPFSGSNDIPSLIANVFLLQAIIPIDEYTWNVPSWSISVEFYTYIVFAAFIVLFRRSSLVAGIAMVIASGSILAFMDIYYPMLRDTQFKGLATCICGFFAGHFMYKIFRLRAGVNRALGTGFEYLAIVAVVLLYWFDPFDSVATIMAFSMVVLVFAFDAGAVSAFLQREPWVFLGKISYSIYMVHFVVLSVLGGLLRATQSVLHTPLYTQYGDVLLMDFGPAGAMDLLALIYALTVILLATLTYRYIEMPGQRFFARIAKREHVPAHVTPEPAVQ